MDSEAKIELGDRVGISASTIVAAGSITIGAGSLVGAECLIVDHDFHPVAVEYRHEEAPAPAPVSIGENVFIGTRAIILKGVTIGEGSVIGAGSVVTRSVPSFSLAAGNPARVIREIKRS